MKICIITTGLGIGGAETQICALSDRFVQYGHNVMIISLTGESYVKPISESIEIIEIKSDKSFLSLIKSLLKVRNILNSYKPDVVHSHQYHANIFSRLLRFIVKFPKLVSTAHSNNEGGYLRMLSYRLTQQLSNITTNVSESAVKEFIKRKANKENNIICIPNGIDSKKFFFSNINRNKKRKVININDDCFLFMAIGRLEKPKGYPVLLKAFSELKQVTKKQNIKLAIIGDGTLREDLSKLVVELNIASNVIFLGIQKDVNEWLSAADCFVLSSEYEGFGLVVAEALLTERLVVATDCGGVKEVLGEGGYLIPPKDSPALAKAMLKALMINPEEKNNLVQKGRDRIIENYSIHAISKKWVNIYKSLE